VKVILKQDVQKLGVAGDVKDVARGYARNYLIPRGIATAATSGAVKEFERRRGAQARREARDSARAEALAERIAGLVLTFEAKAGEKGRLYGSITSVEIAEALGREVGEQFDRRKNITIEPIRELGEHVVPIRLTADIVPEITVVVKPEGDEVAEEAGSSV